VKGLTSFESQTFFVLTVLWAGFCAFAFLYSVQNSPAHFYAIVLPGTAVFVAIVIAIELRKPKVNHPELDKPKLDYPRLRDRLVIIVSIPCVLLILLFVLGLLLQAVCGHGAGTTWAILRMQTRPPAT
jgi:hypothetical protein